MAVTRRGYIFGAFLSSVLSIILIIVSVASDSWVVGSAALQGQLQDSTLRYGLFRGVLDDHVIATPISSTVYMTCVPGMNACALSCKTNQEARVFEVEAMANGLTPLHSCSGVVDIDTGAQLLDPPPVIPFVIYFFVVLLIFLHLGLAAVAALLAVINATKNPTEPIFGLPGCLWANILTAISGLTVLLIFGINWAVSDLPTHLAFSYTVTYNVSSSALGYSYWLLIAATVSSIVNICLIKMRSYLLERHPPTPTLKVENHSDGTIFLY